MNTRGAGIGTRTGARSAFGVWVLALGAAALPLGCGDEEGDGGAGSAGVAGGAGTGSGGKAGTGGAAGNAGTPAGGKAGTAGTSAGAPSEGGNGGEAGAGEAGSPAQGGGAGNGGNAGSSGSSGSGGAGGDAGGERGDGGNGDDDLPWEIIGQLSPLPALPADTTNAYADDAGAAVLGQKFFFEKDFAGPLATLADGLTNDLGSAGETGKVACSSCHLSPVMSDDRSPRDAGSRPANVSLGANFHSRNAPAMVNSSFYVWTNWGGRFSAQWELPMPVTESPVIQNSSRLKVAHVIFDQYKDDYEAVFGAAYGPLQPAIGTDAVRFPPEGKPKAQGAADGPWETMASTDQAIVNRIFVNYGKALAAYTRKLLSRNAPFDRFVARDASAISASAVRGVELFIEKGCVGCHSGPHLSDGGFHNIGVAQSGAHVPSPDDGRFANAPQLLTSGMSAASTTWSDDSTEGLRRQTGLSATMPETTRAAFRTPTLRGVTHSAPYMHAGQLPTLEAVIDFYDRGGDTPTSGTKEASMQPLGLNAQQKADLVAFLESLSGESVPAELLLDTSE
jgi:cytochrome c peroxidase